MKKIIQKVRNVFRVQTHSESIAKERFFFLIDTYSKHHAKWTTAKVAKIENITRKKISKSRKIKKRYKVKSDTKVKRHISKV